MTERLQITTDDYFDLPETTQPTELLHGEIVVSPAPMPIHQEVNYEVATVLKGLVPHGKVYQAPLDVYLEEGVVPQPDVFWVCGPNLAKVQAKRVMGAPDLIVEVLSDGTRRRDRRDKYDLYQKHGVHEYWLVEPSETYVEVYTLDQGQYRRLGVFIPGETFTSPLLQKPVDVSALFPAQ